VRKVGGEEMGVVGSFEISSAASKMARSFRVTGHFCC
jgi:hypothetical protein